jgi:hypothetical protein
MKTFPPLPRTLVYPLVRLLRAWLLICTAACSWAEVEIFELRTSAPFYGQAVTQTEGGANYGIGTFAFAEDWGGVASLTNVGIDPDGAAQQWAFTADGWSATVDATAMAAAHNGDHVLWLDFSVLLNAVPLRHFLIPSARGTHALALVQTDAAGGSPVIAPLAVEGGDISLSGNFTARRASALVDMAKPFWVVDFTTASRSPTGATFLRDGWAGDGASYRIASVSFILDAVCAGEHYTLHWQFPGQAEAMQSLTAASSGLGWVQLGDWSVVDGTGTVSVTGSVGVGANYWLTRDSDGWNCGSRNLDPFAMRPNPLLWSLRGAAAPPVPWQTVTFNIAAGYGWSGASVAQPDGTRSLSPVYNGTLTLADLDEWGNPHDFYYEQWTAQIDPREAYWLTVNGTQCSQGEAWFYNGWSAIGGAAKNPQPVTFGIASGVAWSQSVNDSSGSQGLSLSASGLQIQDYYADGTPNLFNYDLWNATVDVSRPWFLVVNGSVQSANATWFTNGWQWQGGAPLPQNWQTLNFTVPSGMGWFSSVTQASGSWGLNYTGQSGYIEDYWNDGSGTPNFFYYEVFSAAVDVNRPFTLTVSGTPAAPGATTFYGGWAWQGGARENNFTLSLSLNGDRANHDFAVRAPDGTTWPWNPSGSMQWQSSTFTETWSPSANPNAQPPFGWNLQYLVLPTSWSVTRAGSSSGQWTLTDTTTGESKNFNPGQAGAYSLDASQWWLPAQSFDGLKISLSRWSHDLRIRQRNHTEPGGNYLVDKLSSEGSFTPGAAWYESYGYFNATSHRRMIPGMDWWLYDATTGEYSTPDGDNSFIGWIYAPTPENVAAAQSNLAAVEVTWKFPATCGTEMLAGSFTIIRSDIGQMGEAIPAATCRNGQGTPLLFHYTDSGMAADSYTYTIRYSYGGKISGDATVMVTVNDAATLALMDSDEDGFKDLEEFQAGTNPYDANDKPVPLPVPVTLVAVQSAITAVKLTWEFPPNCGPEWLQKGTFAIVRTNLAGGLPVVLPNGQPIPAATYRVDQDAAPLRFLYTDSDLAPGAYAYAIRYSDGHRTSNANITFTVNDEATLANMNSDWDDFTDLEEFQSNTNPYDAASSPPARIVAVSKGDTLLGGKKLVVNLESENGIGAVSYSMVAPLPNSALATVSLSGAQLTVKAKALADGACTIHFTASDTRTTPGSSASGTITIEITPNPLTAFSAGGVINRDGPLPVLVTVSASGGEATETANYTYTVTSRPAHGEITAFFNQNFYPDDVAGSADLTYTPDDPFPEAGDSFEVKVTDDGGTQKIVTVWIAAFQQPPPPPDGVSIVIGPDMKGVVGDEIPSVLKYSGGRHFVSPKKTTAITQENVVLKAEVISQEGKTFDQLYEWDMNGYSFTSDTLNVSRSAPVKYVVKIKEKATGATMDSITVWILWTATTVDRGTGQWDALAEGGARYRTLGPVAGDPVEAGWHFVFTIFPQEIVTSPGDKPDLEGPNSTPPPGHFQLWPTEITYESDGTARWADTATTKWDISRNMSITVRNPKLIAKSFLDQSNPRGLFFQGQPNVELESVMYPEEDAAGNDDPTLRNGMDEEDNPYDPSVEPNLRHLKGEIASFDVPSIGALGPWGEGDNGRTYSLEMDFSEFARVELCGTSSSGAGPRTWYRISEFTPWHHAFKALYDILLPIGIGAWYDNSSSSGEGNLNH